MYSCGSVFFANWVHLVFNLQHPWTTQSSSKISCLSAPCRCYSVTPGLSAHQKKMKSEMEARSQAHYGHSLNQKVCESMGNKKCVLCKAGILRHDTIVSDSSRDKSDTGVELNCFLGLHHMFSVFINRKGLTQYTLFCQSSYQMTHKRTAHFAPIFIDLPW